jgi:hypothetical protein
MIRFSPALKISMGLVFIAVSIVLFGVVSWDSAPEAEYSTNLASAQKSSYFHS